MKHLILVSALLMTGSTWAAEVPPQTQDGVKQEIRDRMEHMSTLHSEIHQRMMQLPPQEREAMMREMMSNRCMKPGRKGGFGHGYELRQPICPCPQ